MAANARRDGRSHGGRPMTIQAYDRWSTQRREHRRTLRTRWLRHTAPRLLTNRKPDDLRAAKTIFLVPLLTLLLGLVSLPVWRAFHG